MIGLKRFIRPGLVVSVVGHVGALLLGLIFVGANSFEAMPPEWIPPDAMVVDVVPPDEAPRLEGTPSNLRSSGSEVPTKSDSASAAAPMVAAKPPAPSPPPQQQRPNPQRNAREATVPTQPAQPETAHAETAQLEMARTETSEPPPAPPQPRAEETPDQPSTAEMLAQLALVGGPLGGGFAAPAIDTTKAAYDFTAPFRERVSSCSALPAGIETGEQISVTLRVFLNRDGTLAAPPQPAGPIASSKEQALVQSAINALQKCQPYTMLPAEKYKQWKTLDLVFFPLNFLGR
jgi:hypothetical protein